MGDVAGVAVAEEHGRPGVRVRHVPAVQPRAVGRLKPGVLERQSRRLPVAVGIAGGKKISEFSRNMAANHDQQIERSSQASRNDAAPAWP